jgi:hypothetical protein
MKESRSWLASARPVASIVAGTLISAPVTAGVAKAGTRKVVGIGPVDCEVARGWSA